MKKIKCQCNVYPRITKELRTRYKVYVNKQITFDILFFTILL